MKKFSTTLPFVVAAFVSAGCAAAFLLWTSGTSSWMLREHLKTISPLFLEINFFLVLIALCLTAYAWWTTPRYRAPFRELKTSTWITLAAAVFLGLSVLMFVVPREHRIYYDEDIYQNIGQTIACTKGTGSHSGEDMLESAGSFWRRFTGQAGMCNEGKNEYGEYSCLRLEYNKEPNGWPYLLSFVFRITGVGERAAFMTNTVLYVLTMLTVFLSGFLLFRDQRAGLFGALLYGLMPEVLIWSNTVAVEPSTAFFTAFAVCTVLLFLRIRSTALLFLCSVVTAFSFQFRPESGMVGMVIAILFILEARDEFRRGRLYCMASLLLALIIPHLVHLYAVRDLGWGSSGPKFSFEYFQENFRVNFLFYLRNMRFSVLTTVLFAAGLVCKSRAINSFAWKKKLPVIVWFLLFWGIFLFFYAGSYNYGADVRFSVVSAVPLALLAGFGAASITAFFSSRISSSVPAYAMTAAVLFAFLSFLPMLRAITQEAWGARADHRYAKEMAEALPPQSVVLTHNPNMFLLWGKNAAQASLATEHPRYFKRFFYRYKGGVYFHYNFWCNVSDRLQNSFCKNILARYDCTPVMSFSERNYSYVLYKVEKKSEGSERR